MITFYVPQQIPFTELTGQVIVRRQQLNTRISSLSWNIIALSDYQISQSVLVEGHEGGAYLCHVQRQHIQLILTYICNHYNGWRTIFFISHHAYVFHASTLVHTNTSQFNINLSSLLGKKNTSKKTTKEDCDLGYAYFTLSLTFHLPNINKRFL